MPPTAVASPRRKNIALTKARMFRVGGTEGSDLTSASVWIDVALRARTSTQDKPSHRGGREGGVSSTLFPRQAEGKGLARAERGQIGVRFSHTEQKDRI